MDTKQLKLHHTITRKESVCWLVYAAIMSLIAVCVIVFG
jgi:hypothetical protein